MTIKGAFHALLALTLGLGSGIAHATERDGTPSARSILDVAGEPETLRALEHPVGVGRVLIRPQGISYLEWMGRFWPRTVASLAPHELEGVDPQTLMSGLAHALRMPTPPRTLAELRGGVVRRTVMRGLDYPKSRQVIPVHGVYLGRLVGDPKHRGDLFATRDGAELRGPSGRAQVIDLTRTRATLVHEGRPRTPVTAMEVSRTLGNAMLPRHGTPRGPTKATRTRGARR